MQVLLDKMKHDTEWIPASRSYDPLTLLRLIERTILAQTQEQYPYATVYDQECALYGFSQNSGMSNGTNNSTPAKIDVGPAIGVTRQHQISLQHVAAKNGTTKFKDLSNTDQERVRTKAEEQYIWYVFLRQSGKHHNKLKVDLQKDFTTGDNRYPKNCQQTLHLLDKYSKSSIVNATTTSEGSVFAQRGGKDNYKDTSNQNLSERDQEYWKTKTCYNCNKKGHPSSYCPEKKKGWRCKQQQEEG
jgi:hypothetical protein